MSTQPTGSRPRTGRTSGVSAPPSLPPRLPPRAETTQPTSRTKRIVSGAAKTGKVCFYTFVPLVILALMAAGILYVRLRHGPIAFDFLVPPIEHGINAELSNNSVNIEGAELRLGRDGFLEFRLRNLSVLEPDGDTVLASPLAAFSVSAAALMRGRVVPARIELIDPVINLLYTDEAGLVFEKQVTRRKSDKAPALNDASSHVKDGTAQTTASKTPSTDLSHHLNVAKMLTDASKRARKGIDATSYLTEFGISNATVVIEYAGQKTAWNIPDGSIDFNHARRRSVISGRATVSSLQGSWSFSFLTDESERTGRLQVKATVRDLVPATLAGAAPPLALLRMLEAPLSGDTTVELSSDGTVENSELSLALGQGRLTHAALTEPFEISAGLIKLTYDGKARRWDLHPSPVKWSDGSIMFAGSMQDVAEADHPPDWNFKVEGSNGVFEAAEFGVPPVAVDSWLAEGSIVPRRGVVDISSFLLKGGGGEARLKATTQAGPSGQSTLAEVTFSPMPLETLKAMWPRALARGARQWIGESVTAASFKGGALRFATGDYLTHDGPIDPAVVDPVFQERVSGSFEFADIAFVPLPGMAPIAMPRVSVQLKDNALEATAPEGRIELADKRLVPLKEARLYAPNVMSSEPVGEITVATASQLGPFLDAVEQVPVRAVREAAPFPKAGDGKVDAQIKIVLPLVTDLSEDGIKIEGKAKITDGRFGKVAGQFDVQGFTLNLDLSQTELNAKGDLLVNGVPAKIVGQRLLAAGSDQQPPMKVVAKLDDADRKQLGIDQNEFIRGIVPIEITMHKTGQPEPVIKLKADLTDAELVLDPIAWRKAPGRRATLETDVVSGKQKTELQNFKVVGDDIAIDGWITADPDKRVREFYFPTFSLNVISRLEVQGKLDAQNIWSIQANGPTFDARNLFRSMFAVGNGEASSGRASSKSADGVNFTAAIGNVIGGSEVSLRSFKLSAAKRNDRIVTFDAKGTLDGGAPVAIALDQSGGERRIVVNSPDAGQFLKLVGFYSNMQGGRLKLDVNLDGRGAAEKTGVLLVDGFKVLGDPIVSEVVGSADQSRPAISGNRHVTREVFEFDKMRAPFSVGYGQFVLEQSYIKGPLLGANLRGKVDFKTQRVNLGGTYIPLQGINGAFGSIPLLGQLISGAQGEGIFGITFGVQGPMANPQVLVNPLSLVAPGIFREIFQMTGNNPQVQVRDDRPVWQAESGAKASSASAGRDRAAKKKKSTRNSDVVDGWSSTTSP